MANTKPTVLDGLVKRRLAFHGHLVRKGDITLVVMIERLHGTRPKGKPRITWLKDLVRSFRNLSMHLGLGLRHVFLPTFIVDISLAKGTLF